MAAGFRLNDWESDGSVLGTGSFATVYKAKNITTGNIVAIKVMSLQKVAGGDQKTGLARLAAEIQHQMECKSPYTVPLHSVFQSDGNLYLVMELCWGDLAGLLRKNGGLFPERTTQFLSRQLALGLKCLNDLNIVHRDLKPQNILVTLPNPADPDPITATLKISDFGFARFLNEHTDETTGTLCGSPLYMAPEIFLNGRYGAKADLYSAGAIILEMLSGRTPYHLKTLHGIIDAHRREVRNPVPISDTLLNDLSPSCVSLLRGLLEKQPVKRISFAEFFDHPWLELADELRSPIGAQFEEIVPTAPPTTVDSASLRRDDSALLATLREIEQALPPLDDRPYASLFEQSLTLGSLDEFAKRVSTFTSRYSMLIEENRRLDARQKNSIAIRGITSGDQVMFHGAAGKPFTYKAYNPEQSHFLSEESLQIDTFKRNIAQGKVIFGYVVEVVDEIARAGNPYDLPAGTPYCKVLMTEKL